MSGWLKISRDILDDPMYLSEPFTRMQAWIDLLFLANYKDSTLFIRNIEISVKRGQVCRSAESLASRWRWSRGKVLRFLNALENEQKIVQQKSHVITLISVNNYEDYQSCGTTDSTTDGTHKKKVNKESNNNMFDFEQFWNIYDKKVSRQKAQKLFDKLSTKDREQIFATLPAYIASTPEKKFRKDPATYLRNRAWEDEIISAITEKKPELLKIDVV